MNRAGRAIEIDLTSPHYGKRKIKCMPTLLNVDFCLYVSATHILNGFSSEQQQAFVIPSNLQNIYSVNRHHSQHF